MRIFQASEDVTSAAHALDARSQLESVAQYRRNVENGQDFVAAADAKLTSLVDLVNEIDALALSVDNDHVTPEDRNFAAQEMNQKLESLLEYANAQFGDRYLFSGHGTTTAPYNAVRDTNGRITSVEESHGSISGQIYRTIDENETVAINITGTRLFVPQGEANSAADIFYVVAQLRDTIANDNTPPEGQEGTLSTHVLRDNLDVIRKRIIDQQTYLGSLGQRLESKLSDLQEVEIGWTDRLEQAQGADTTELVSRLATEEGVYNALLAIQSRILTKSLIDYIG